MSSGAPQTPTPEREAGGEPSSARARAPGLRRRRLRPPRAEILALEALARGALARGLPVWLQPTTVHRGLAAPVLAYALLAALVAALAPLSAALAALLALLWTWSLWLDLDGGRSPLRLLLPRRPGWAVELALLDPDRALGCLVLWLPGQAPPPGLDERLPAWSRAFAAAAPPGLRLLCVVGTDGARWHDDLEIVLRSRRHRLVPGATAVAVLLPGGGPHFIEPEGPLSRPASPDLAAALRGLGYTPVRGRSAALRALRLGVPAIALRVPDLDAATLAPAVRALGATLAGPSPETPG